MGAKEIEPEKSQFFFFSSSSSSSSSSKISCRSHGIHITLTSNLYKCLAAQTLSCEELEQKKNKWEELTQI